LAHAFLNNNDARGYPSSAEFLSGREIYSTTIAELLGIGLKFVKVIVFGRVHEIDLEIAARNRGIFGAGLACVLSDFHDQ